MNVSIKILFAEGTFYMKNHILKPIALCLTLACIFAIASACNTKQNINTSTTGATTTETPTTETPTTASPAPEPEKQPTVLKFASFNIANGRNVNHNFQTLGEDIKAMGLDIVGLQEVDHMADRSGNQDTMRLLSQYSGLPYYTYFRAIDIAGGEYGLGILSRYPIAYSRTIPLYSGDHEQRVLGHATIQLENRYIQFFVTHLSHENTSVRKNQFAEIAGYVGQYEDFVLTGDFNTDNFAEYALIEGAAAVNTAESHVVTFPKNTSSIDNIVYGAGRWSFTGTATNINDHSDHYMLYSTGTYIEKE